MKLNIINSIILLLATGSNGLPAVLPGNLGTHQSPMKFHDKSLESGYHDVKTAAKVARTLVQRESMVNLNTIDQNSGFPVSFVEYYADCNNDGTPIMLIIDISSSNKNIEQGSKASLSIRVGDHQYNDKVDPHYKGGIVRSTAGSPRVNFKGHFVKFDPTIGVQACFASRHKESTAWFPGGPVHSSHWAKFEIEEIYMVGGFGDRAYIGNIPLDEYFNATSFDDDKKKEGSSLHYHNLRHNDHDHVIVLHGAGNNPNVNSDKMRLFNYHDGERNDGNTIIEFDPQRRTIHIKLGDDELKELHELHKLESIEESSFESLVNSMKSLLGFNEKKSIETVKLDEISEFLRQHYPNYSEEFESLKQLMYFS